MVISGSRMALGFNPKWVVHASRVFIPTSSLQFSWLLPALKLIFHVDKQAPIPFFCFPIFFLILQSCPSPTQFSVEILWCEANMCEGWDHSHYKTVHIFQQIVSGWKNAFDCIGLANFIFSSVSELYVCPYIFI